MTETVRRLRQNMTAGPYSIHETDDGYYLHAGGGGEIARFRFRGPAEYVCALLNADVALLASAEGAEEVERGLNQRQRKRA